MIPSVRRRRADTDARGRRDEAACAVGFAEERKERRAIDLRGVALDGAGRRNEAIDVWIRGGFDSAATARARELVASGA